MEFRGMIMKCNIVYFSPTYTTKRIVTMIANDITEDTTYFDITQPNVDTEKLSFGRNDFVIIGIPVYSGRVPNLARNIIATMHGDETPIVLVATYGNRHYDDSLLELKNIVQSNRFLAVAASAFVTEHSVVQKFGAGRPDDEDIKLIHKFAQDVKYKINKMNFHCLKYYGNVLNCISVHEVSNITIDNF